MSGSGAKIAMVCNITPASAQAEETLNTLKFATRAKLVRCPDMDGMPNQLYCGTQQAGNNRSPPASLGKDRLYMFQVGRSHACMLQYDVKGHKAICGAVVLA